MTDEPHTPVISIGFFVIPMAVANFSTEEDGRNSVLENYTGFCNEVLQETCHKLTHLAKQIVLGMQGELKHLTKEEMHNIVRCCVDGGVDKYKQGAYGVMTPEGRIITDEQTVEHILNGGTIS